jgi:hypothetical protein
VLQRCDLTEEIPRSELGNVFAVARDLRATVLDDHELVRELALVQELLALAHVDLVRHLSHPADVALAEGCEQGDRLELALVHFDRGILSEHARSASRAVGDRGRRAARVTRRPGGQRTRVVATSPRRTSGRPVAVSGA